MSYILATNISGHTRYLKATAVRWDNKKLPILTAQLNEAKTFSTQHEAATLITRLITSKKFITEPLQKANT